MNKECFHEPKLVPVVLDGKLILVLAGTVMAGTNLAFMSRDTLLYFLEMARKQNTWGELVRIMPGVVENQFCDAINLYEAYLELDGGSFVNVDDSPVFDAWACCPHCGTRVSPAQG